MVLRYGVALEKKFSSLLEKSPIFAGLFCRDGSFWCLRIVAQDKTHAMNYVCVCMCGCVCVRARVLVSVYEKEIESVCVCLYVYMCV